MFKKFVDFFFEDVEEQDEEIIEEEVREVTRETVVRKPMADISLTPKPVQEAPASAPSEMEFYEVAQKPSRFIDLDEVKKEIRPARKEHRVEIKDMRTNTYEFNSVISPIFGVREGSEESYKEKSTSSSEQSEESILGTVFSPMYGRQPSFVSEKSEEKKVSEEQQEKSEAIQREDSLPPMYELEDILSTTRTNPHEEAHQFSIFDDFGNEGNHESHLESELSEFFDSENK